MHSALFDIAAEADGTVVLERLEKLGRLPPDTDPTQLMQLAQHSHPKVRLAAAKNLGKLQNLSLLPFLAQCAQREPNTLARREFVSAIGRLRRPEAIPYLLRFLEDADPKVVL
jgi:HEAT repeat protein